MRGTCGDWPRPAENDTLFRCVNANSVSRPADARAERRRPPIMTATHAPLSRNGRPTRTSGAGSRASSHASPPRAPSLIVTVWGDALAPHGGAVVLPGLIGLLAPFGINERLVRTSVFRLARDGWLAAQRRSAGAAAIADRRRRAAIRRRAPPHLRRARRRWDDDVGARARRRAGRRPSGARCATSCSGPDSATSAPASSRGRRRPESRCRAILAGARAAPTGSWSSRAQRRRRSAAGSRWRRASPRAWDLAGVAAALPASSCSASAP